MISYTRAHRASHPPYATRVMEGEHSNEIIFEIRQIRIERMAQNHSSCPSCSKKYAGFGGEDVLHPVIMPCLCRFCKGCALVEEAKAQQHQLAVGGGKKGKGKGKAEAEHTPTPCMICARLCKTPVAHLLLDTVLMKRVDCGHAAVSVPLCDMCEEKKATKYCSDCTGNRFSCDSCFVLTHKFAKKQGALNIKKTPGAPNWLRHSKIR